MKNKKLIFISFILLISMIFCSCGSTADTQATNNIAPQASPLDGMAVHFIDVGQADCELITANGYSILIDGGNVDDGESVVEYLKAHSITRLDAVFATHAHEDHVGGLADIINAFEVKSVYSPTKSSTTKCFNAFVAAAEKQCGVTVVEGGRDISFGNMHIRLLWPYNVEALDANNSSIVMRVTYGNISFMFTGDVEKECETKIVESSEALSANVLKVAHHGSSSSTGYLFLRSVMPQFAVISCGKGNSYGHPHQETLDILEQAEVKTYRTDELGTVVATTDGEKISFAYGNSLDTVEGEARTAALDLQQATVAPTGEYIGNKKSKKYHVPTCASLPIEANRVYFATSDEAEGAGYTPCANCIK